MADSVFRGRQIGTDPQNSKVTACALLLVVATGDGGFALTGLRHGNLAASANTARMHNVLVPQAPIRREYHWPIPGDESKSRPTGVIN
jgi:hypothetical protein